MVLDTLMGGGQQRQAPQWRSDEREFDENDFIEPLTDGSGNVPIDGTGFQLFGEVRVGAKQRMEFGHGNQRLEAMEQGRPRATLQNSDGEQVNGTVRFLHVSAQEGKTQKIRDISTRTLDETTKSERDVFPRASRPARPDKGAEAASQDDYLRMQINVSNISSLTSSNINLGNSTLTIPVTVWERA